MRVDAYVWLLLCLHDGCYAELVKRSRVDVCSYCGSYTMDVIASTGFGLQIDSHNDPKNQFVQMSNKAMEFSLKSLRVIIMCESESTWNICLIYSIIAWYFIRTVLSNFIKIFRAEAPSASSFQNI